MLALTPRAAVADLDAGASTFRSGAERYRARTPRDAEIPVPRVEATPNLPSVPDAGPGDAGLRFRIDRFEVKGNTLVPPSQVDEALASFLGDAKSIADVQAARDALQRVYEEAGFVTVAVGLPQQTIDRGVVRLDVVEARLGSVEVANEGVRWFGDEGVLADTPHLRSGELLRMQDLERDLARANRTPDRVVRPSLRAGKEPGSVDVVLLVEDRLPLHAEVELNNDYTRGSPPRRSTVTLSYGNLWDLMHEASVSYQFVPTHEFDDVQVMSGSYRAPMPWSSRQSLFAYIANSESANAVVSAPGLSVVGQGLNMGLRYLAELPEVAGVPWFSHRLTLGVDRKDIENTLQQGTAQVTTPITYLPWLLEYGASASGDHAYGSVGAGVHFHFAGTLPGGAKEDFQANRGGARAGNPVDGDYLVWRFRLQHGLRLPSLLRTLAAGRFIELPKPSRPFASDWTLALAASGQVASQPLISTEQFLMGGIDTVRGYFQSEAAGDQGWSAQLELRSPYFPAFLGDWMRERAQLVLFYDVAELFTLNAGEGETPDQRIQSLGVGIRGNLLERLDAEVFAAFPRASTDDTPVPRFLDETRYHFRVRFGF